MPREVFMNIEANLYMAASAGALYVLRDQEPNSHTRRARLANEAGQLIEREIGRKLPRPDQALIDKAVEIFRSLEDQIGLECKKYVLPAETILINFVLCNLESLPANDKVDRKIKQLSELYIQVQGHLATTLGMSLWKRLMKEVG